MRKKYFNLSFDQIEEKKALEICREIIRGHKLKSLFFLNAHCFNVAQKNVRYKQALNSADLILNDGIGLKLGGYLTGLRITNNLNGTDLIPKIIEMGIEENKKFYFIGSTTETLRKAKEELEKKDKNIQIEGVYHGFFTEKDEQYIIDEINRKEIDILIVGMGVPKQELWIEKIRKELKTVKLSIAGGAIFDFISQRIKRAPLWMQKMNIEWIFRLLIEPKRMWKRYLVGNFEFFFKVLYLSFRTKINPKNTATNKTYPLDANS